MDKKKDPQLKALARRRAEQNVRGEGRGPVQTPLGDNEEEYTLKNDDTGKEHPLRVSKDVPAPKKEEGNVERAHKRVLPEDIAAIRAEWTGELNKDEENRKAEDKKRGKFRRILDILGED